MAGAVTVVVAPSSWAEGRSKDFWRTAVLFSHEECYPVVASGELPSFFEGPFEDTCFVLVATGLPSLHDPAPCQLAGTRFQRSLTEACFAGDLLRLFVRLTGIGVPSLLLLPKAVDPCVQAVAELPRAHLSSEHINTTRAFCSRGECGHALFHSVLN